jgi:hypothetical protein
MLSLLHLPRLGFWLLCLFCRFRLCILLFDGFIRRRLNPLLWEWEWIPVSIKEKLGYVGGSTYLAGLEHTLARLCAHLMHL